MPSTDVRYRDLNLIFTPHPVRKDISTLADADAVKRSVVNLVLTKHFERPFHPEIGCNATAMLFENISPITALRIQRSIQDVINNFEPRVKLLKIDVVASADDNGYTATIYFYIQNFSDVQTVQFFLERLR